jgi:dGTPase
MSEELKCYAVSEQLSRGRIYAEKPHRYRSDFERDRDRIIHSTAFRRLEGKTQVFTPGLDDYYRTRLTHSLEVAQIGRTIAKALKLNETLTEAICLAHDLGHPPFGHAGEKVLNDLMSRFGGFEHNRQTLRIVELLEHPYADFAGLNLMYETRLGLAKHQSPYDQPESENFDEKNCSLEGQIADIADRIAYNCHDLEDGLRAGIIGGKELKNFELFAEAQKQINVKAIKDAAVARMRTAKIIIEMLVSDCIEASEKRIGIAGIETIEDVYGNSENLIVLSQENNSKLEQLEKFLLENFYSHKSLLQTSGKIRQWLGALFGKLCKEQGLMPDYYQQLAAKQGLERTVCDYIAGMTDRYCLKMLENE